MKYKVKLIVGFRRDQEHSIDATEAHKAYYLFLNPDQRGIFSNGLAIKGSQIDEIVPDYHGTMGWNPSHNLSDDDYNELRKVGVEQKMQFIMAEAKTIGARGDVGELNTPLTILLKGRFGVEQIHDGSKSMKELIAGRNKNQT